MFDVKRSSLSIMLREVVHSINVVFRGEISWPRGQQLLDTEAQFRNLCNLLGIVSAIDGIHIAISKPKVCSSNYYFKSAGFTLNCQAVVDNNKRFLDLFLGMPGSTNDSRVLRRSSLYVQANNGSVWDVDVSFQGFTPYLLDNARYPCLLWLMVPHLEHGNILLAKSLFNWKLKLGMCVVENSFAILKQFFCEFLHKIELHVTFVHDVIVACTILHNMLHRQHSVDAERLRHVLRMEGFTNDASPNRDDPVDLPIPITDDMPAMVGV